MIVGEIDTSITSLGAVMESCSHDLPDLKTASRAIEEHFVVYFVEDVMQGLMGEGVDLDEENEHCQKKAGGFHLCFIEDIGEKL